MNLGITYGKKKNKFDEESRREGKAEGCKVWVDLIYESEESPSNGVASIAARTNFIDKQTRRREEGKSGRK